MTEQIDHQKVQEYSLQYAEALVSSFFTSEKSFITGNEILTFSTVKQVNFFILKSLFVTWKLEMDKLKSPYFDYEHPESKAAIEQFMNTISRHIKVNKKDITSIVISAVQETIYLVISPFEFFYAEFTQNTSEVIELSFLKNELKYIKTNKALMQALIDEVKAKHGQSASQAEVIEILEGLLSKEGLMEEPDALLVSFSNLVPVTKENLLVDQPIPEEIEDQIETNEQNDAKEETFFDSVLKEEEEQEENEPESEEDTDLSIALDQDDETSEVIAEDDAVLETETEEDTSDLKPNSVLDALSAGNKVEDVSIPELEEDLGIAPLDSKEAESASGSLNDNFSVPDTVLNDTLKEKDPEPPLAEVLEAQSDPETLLNTMSINHGYMFINELFKGNADEFNLAMERLETCKNFDAAVELLVQKYARPFTWDMNSKEVKELLKVIFRRFR